ncbi:16S rRNA (cytosine(967)-C(5))-methyltransferase RsmB [Culicoidibacter larvae]|uniref:16S rRNA (cytosine(967)-C(5))-methyltransferase RsmB n=1 Tax=Culicoidibacter larvae TaxID=2579976 RepID=UPI0014855F9D|nr:16S rRNA (cytosine(967)-C(5))-methyltransferase RsmB [Culicoidibacter larvae]
MSKQKASQARKVAFEVLDAVFRQGAYSNIALNQALSAGDFSVSERGLITEIVYGVLQHKLLLDYYLAPFIDKKLPKKWMLPLLESAVYQLVFLDKVPSYAVLNETIDIAKRKGGSFIGKMVTAILRNFERNERPSLEHLPDNERLSVATSHPLWLVDFLLKQYPMTVVEPLLEQNNLPPLRVARINHLKTGDLSVFDAGPIAGSVTLNRGNIAHTEAYNAGLVAIQDLSSQHVAPMLAPLEGERILDMCAAPGGKTMHIADLMKNTGEIIANDLHEHKLELMREAAERLGVTNVTFSNYDALELPKVFEAGAFDRILLDAPCSGLGVIRRKPDLRYRISKADLDSLVGLQAELLTTAWQLLKAGGTLVYSTCTINHFENQDQVQAFLAAHQDAELEAEIDFAESKESDGFYIAKMKKH